MRTLRTSAAFTPHRDVLRAISLPGHGPIAVHLHGLGCHGAASWAEVAALRGHPALLVDLPGHGRSDAPSGYDYTLPSLARAVAALLDAQEPGRFEILGHSLGGAVAAHLASLRPDLVERLVLVEPALDQATPRPGDIADVPEGELDRDRWRTLLATETPWRRADMKLTDPIGLIRSARALGDEHAARTSELLLEAQTPALVVSGDHREYHDENRFAEHHVSSIRISGAGHFVMNDEPEAFLAAVERFEAHTP